MSKFDEIIPLVRRCSVSLFIGSGFSLKAGAPSSDMLKKAIARAIPGFDERRIAGRPLDDIAQDLIRYYHGDRSILIKVLEDQMAFQRADMSDHQKLAQIPHFSRIFTTNYDSLLEEAFENQLNVVRCNEDCANDLGEVNLYKIHGDLTQPDQLVISRKDYDDLLATNKNRFVWNKVYDAFTGSDVVFIGYSLDDTNVQRVLEAVSKAVGNKRRKVFLIAPGLTEVKVDELCRYDVVYIDAYADEFLTAVTNALMDCICKDMTNGLVPVDVAGRFLNHYQVSADIEFLGGEIVVKGFHATDQSIPQTIHITIPAGKDSTKNPFEFVSDNPEQSKYLKGPTVAFTKDMIRSFEFRINGLRIMGMDDIGRFEMAPATIEDGKIDVLVDKIRFLENAPYRLYIVENRPVMSIDTPICELEVSWSVVDDKVEECNLRTIYKDEYHSYWEAVEWTRAFVAIFSGSEIRIGDRLVGSFNPENYKGLTSLLQKSLQYYEDVHEIELQRKKTFAIHKKYEEEGGEMASMIRHLLLKDTFEEKLYTDGRIEVVIDPNIDLDNLQLRDLINCEEVRVSQTTEDDVVLNGVNFGRISRVKILPKSHIDNINRKDGKTFVSICPDTDHWLVRFVTAGNEVAE